MSETEAAALDIRLGELIALDLKGELKDRTELIQCADVWHQLWLGILAEDRSGIADKGGRYVTSQK
ncbi:hypothetical protein [Deefgea piscis]|uniref:hypothetical protein n=1 Tax=Deefgea piscis TaxID=2739061 RepID=UPI001C7EB9CF|nr:hypothetical protein [Deefgea piscis]QZA80173.1 hypothetical protein K4H25_11580 [Deefgea piscis]